jgi:beta-galactosidase
MGGKSYEGRDEGGVMKSAIAYFEALSEMGVQTNLKEISEYDFGENSYESSVIILPHQISIPSKYWPVLESFVKKGGKLVADGLTGYYDENAVATMRLGFPLRHLLGADVLEYKAIDDMNELVADGIALPAYQWRGILRATTATALAYMGDELCATKNQLEKGMVFWLPSMVGLGSRILGNYHHLNMFLDKALNYSSLNLPFIFEAPQKGVMMKVMGNSKEWVTILINKSNVRCEFKLVLRQLTLQPIVIFANHGGKAGGNHISIEAEETLVIKWV